MDLNKKTAVSYFAEWRSGLPFSAHNDEGLQVGSFNSFRYPAYLNLNLYLRRKVDLLGHKWDISVGSDNITNEYNPTLANGNVTAWQFFNNGRPIFYGSQPRKPLVLRVRWLGKK